jgi:hypothetical protein
VITDERMKNVPIKFRNLSYKEIENDGSEKRIKGQNANLALHVFDPFNDDPF